MTTDTAPLHTRYPVLDAPTFGRQLLTSGDLDPVYVALNRSSLAEAQRFRWLVAYIAFYDVAAACWLSERSGEAFWEAMATAAANVEPAPYGGRWPRGHERRHFRGGQAVAGVADWRTRHHDPERMFSYISAAGHSFEALAARAREHRSVGPWLAFKVVDLVDACLGGEVSQDRIEPFIYDAPRESLLQIAKDFDIEGDPILATLAFLKKEFHGLGIPHKPWKGVDLFALETIACKHGSHRRGHYPLNNDILDIRKGLEKWRGTCETVEAFEAFMPVATVSA